MAAINAIATMLKSGDHVVCGNDLYGGMPRLFNQVLTGFGLEFTYVDTSDAKNVERAIRKNTRMVYVETPTNPLMALERPGRDQQDLPPPESRTGGRQHFHVALFSAADLALGADMVVHSTTKFLNGHSDGLGGVVVCTQAGAGRKARFSAEGCGRDPFSVRMLAGAARRENAGGAHGACTTATAA